ncbi:MAG: STAS domain-containing protein [Polyangiaceae bacterium]|jgi:rsbT antagonist protein RsbS|nr:STAS domain-containing protein [Polyangiaceae bacterium]
MAHRSPGTLATRTQIPILRVEGCLIASIQQSLHDDDVIAFEQSLRERVAAESALGGVIDITALDAVDSFMARTLNDIALSVGLLGAKVAVVGIQPSAAITMVKIGFSIPRAITALDLEKGLRALRAVVSADELALTTEAHE